METAQTNTYDNKIKAHGAILQQAKIHLKGHQATQYNKRI